MTRSVPFSAETEEAIIGACLYSRRNMELGYRGLVAADFYVPKWAASWAVMVDLHESGSVVDYLSVIDRLRSQGRTDPNEAELIGIRDASGSALPTYIEIVLRLRAAREVLTLSAELTEAGYLAEDPYAAAEAAIAGLGALSRARGLLTGFDTFDGVLDTDAAVTPYVVDNLLRRDERIVFVGAEGTGKSTLVRQWALCISQGVHPLTFRAVDPHRVLIVDAENSLTVIQETGALMRRLVQGRLDVAYDPARLYMLRRPQGMDLRSRRSRGEFESAVEASQPEVVFAGPVYQLAGKARGERDDDYALDMMRIFNDLRTRYSFALILEDHAPQGENGHRKMRPFGSARWLAWPEFGIGLGFRPKDGALVIETFRGHRANRQWPTEFVRSHTWPWEARFPAGTFHTNGKTAPLPVTGARGPDDYPEEEPF